MIIKNVGVEQLKILIINEFTRTPGGIDNVVNNTVLGLKKRPFLEVKVFGNHHTAFDSMKIISKIKAFRKAKAGLYQYKELRSVIDSFKPDIIHIHNTYPLISQLIYRIHKAYSKIPIIYHLHNFYPFCLNSYFYVKNNICTDCLGQPNWKQGIFKKCYHNSFRHSILISQLRSSPLEWVELSNSISIFIAVSQFVNQFYRKAGIQKEKIKTLYNPVSLPECKPVINPKGKYVLFIGRLTEAKGIDILYRLILDNPDINFKIAGDGPAKIRFENLIKSGRNNLEILGFINGKIKNKIFQNAKLVLVPSQWWETFGLVVIEANSFGKKVVASNTGGITELIDDGFNGYLCDPKDYRQFHERVRTAFFEEVDLETHQKIQLRAYQYSVDNYVKKLISLYMEVLSK